MTRAALRLWLILALRLRCVAVPLDRGRAARQEDGGSDAASGEEVAEEALMHVKDSPRGAAAPHKKAPQFMVDLFNAVSVSDGSPKSQKEILEGNIVRSFEDKGE